MELLNQILRSSKDPEKLSLTVKGTLMHLVPVAVGLSYVLGVQTIDEQILRSLVDVLAALVTTFTVLLGLGMQAYGLIRKLF